MTLLPFFIPPVLCHDIFGVGIPVALHFNFASFPSSTDKESVLALSNILGETTTVKFPF